MYVVGVDFGDMRVGHDDEWEVTEGLYAMCEASGKDREREIG